MNKKIILGSFALAATLIIGQKTISKVYAQESENSFPPMLQGLVERFGLNESEVESYVQEQREQRQVEMKARHQETLNQAVTDGKITEDQKNLLLQKMDEHNQERGQEREEFRNWAQENGINLDEVFPMGNGFRGESKGRGQKGMF